MQETTKVLQPVLLGGLIRYFTGDGEVPLLHAYLYALGVSVCAVIIAIVHHPYFFLVTRMGMWLRIASCSMIYKKVRS
jgi:ATP-binding cassette subfamily C (CFTR/MRP) protein 4